MPINDKKFYIYRLNKIGRFHEEPDLLFQAFRESPGLTEDRFGWTIIEQITQPGYIYGKLCKYALIGSTQTLDLNGKSIRTTPTQNQIKAVSEYLYIPTYSGIAFHPIYPDIPQSVFVKKFPQVLMSLPNLLMARLEIEAISDIRIFSARIRGLTDISKIHALVRPPNPSFSPLWEEIKEYLKKRRVSQLEITEETSGQSINSKIPELVTQIFDENQRDIPPAELADAALLMAADGYGEGYVDGRKGSKKERVWTSHAQINFKIRSQAEHGEIFEAAESILQKASNERRMMH